MKTLCLLLLSVLTTISVNAQVGIGTTSPNTTLDVRGSLALNSRSFSTTSETVLSTDYTLLFTGSSACTLTMPDATAWPGRIINIKNTRTGTVPVLTIATTSSQTIDGASTWLLDDPNETTNLVSDGSNWRIVGSGSGTSWAHGGNTVGSEKKLGTIDGYALPFITNNTERMRITTGGSVGIGSSTFNGTYPERLLVDAGSTGNTDFQNVIVGKGNTNSYAQLNIQNFNAGAGASSDVVATADNGNETVNYIDMGINSSTYSGSNILSGINNAYLYSTGNDLVIGNATASKNLIFFTGGTAASNEHLRITGNGVTATGSQTATYLNVSGNYTLLSTDFIVISTGAACTWTLPAASSYPGRILHIVNHGTGTLTLSPGIKTSSSATLDTSLSTSAGSNTEKVISDGTNWVKISN
jgi:hypothetical protein